MPLDNDQKIGLVGAAVQGATAIGRGIGASARQKRARKWQLEDWDRVNAYNHPQAQMQRLKEAKLNPQLAVGGTSTGNASSIDTNNLDTSVAEEISAGAADTVNSYQDNRVKQSQVQNLKADALKKAAETINTGIKNETDAENLKAVKEFSFMNAHHVNRKLEADADVTIQEGEHRRRLYDSLESSARSKAALDSAEAKLKKAGLSKAPWSVQAMRMLSRDEIQVLIQAYMR